MAVIAVAGCTRQPLARDGDLDAGTPPGESEPDSGTPMAVAKSTRNNLRFKGPERLTADFASALELPPDQVCNELGQYSCAESVHTVTLGGVDPYQSGLYDPLPITGVTTPIAVDRMALAGCSQRVALDVAAPSQAVLFRGVALDAQGRLVDREGTAVRDAINGLYQRGLQRDAQASEMQAWLQLAADIESSTRPAPGRDWMTAVCFAVLSSAESVFF
ncbi:hypothetical protein [Comamonas sp. JC664]|uniref:hypothetical protein n=1 Tax=Comamonas sp. JC664 TaxID=2801917 RepID=UPI00191DD93F|nr:hypothetical protein [Comamonas sp. JC664]MBL0692013.1 hypothetical protein [Comamonas sp. JC664]GHH04286.1 hypothetical protein GCM10012319_73630 [Comamonas sp. KCTC 72670]